MITTGRDIETILFKNGYNQIGATRRHAKIYMSNIRELKTVIVIEAIQAEVSGTCSLNAVIREAEEKYNILLAVDPLIILIGSSRTHKLYGKNMMTIDCSDSKIKCRGYSARYEKECLDFIDFSKKQRKIAKANLDISKRVNGNYSTWILYIIMMINVCCFYNAVKTGGLGFAGYTSNNGLEVYAISAKAIIVNKEYVRLISYMFEHGSIGHLFGNVVSLYLLGKMLLKRKGTLRFLAVYMLGGISAGYLSSAYHYFVMKDLQTITVGASGAIFALLGALVMDVLTDDNMIGMKKRFAGFACAMLIFNSIGFNIDWIGHVGGFLSGMLLMWYINKIDQIVMNLSEMKICNLKANGRM